MIKAVIIDDNKLAIATLRAEVEEHCDTIQLVGSAEGVIEAAKLLKEVEADLLFLDIHMNNGTGFDLLDILEDKKYAVIFTTASPDFAIKAFQYTAIDYLLKPIDPERLVEAVAKVDAKKAVSSEQLSILKSDQQQRIALSTTEEIRVVAITEIMRLESSNNYTTFHVSGGEKILVSKTMKEYEFLLDNHFIRVHQSHIVNIKQIKSYVKTEGGYILLSDDTHIPVSVRRKPEVIKALNG